MKVSTTQGSGPDMKETSSRTVDRAEAFKTLVLVLESDPTSKFTRLQPTHVSLSRCDGRSGTEFQSQSGIETRAFRQLGAVLDKAGKGFVADNAHSLAEREKILGALNLPDAAWNLLRDLHFDRSYLVRASAALIATTERRPGIVSVNTVLEAIHFTAEGFSHSVEGWLSGRLAPHVACPTR